MWKSLLIFGLCQAAFGARLNEILRPRYRRSNAAFHDPWYYGFTDYSDFDSFHKHGAYPHDGPYYDHGVYHDHRSHHGHDHGHDHGSYHGHDHGYPNGGYHDHHGYDHGPWNHGYKHEHKHCTVQHGSTNFDENTPWNLRSTQITTISTEDPQSAARLTITVCMRSCPVTSEYNPVCGTNDVTYSNLGRLECAKSCGVDVSLQKATSCINNVPLPPIITTVENLVTPTPSQPRPTTSENVKITTQTPDFNPTRYTTIDVSSVDFDSPSTMGIPASTEKVLNINTIPPNSEIKPTRFSTVDVPKLSTAEPNSSTFGNEQTSTDGIPNVIGNEDVAPTRPTARPPYTAPANVLADIFTNSPGFDTTLDEQINIDIRQKEEDESIVFPDE